MKNSLGCSFIRVGIIERMHPASELGRTASSIPKQLLTILHEMRHTWLCNVERTAEGECY